MHSRTSVSLALATLVVIGPSGIRAAMQASTSPQAQREDAPGMYRALLINLAAEGATSTFIVQSTPVQMSAPTDADWQRLGDVPAALKAAAGAPASDAVLFTAASFAGGVQLVTKEAVQAIFRTPAGGTTIDERWNTFRTRYRAKSFQSFSRPVISPDGLDALVYYTHSCGPVCGEAGYTWLRRTSPAAPWTVVKRLPKVIA